MNLGIKGGLNLDLTSSGSTGRVEPCPGSVPMPSRSSRSKDIMKKGGEGNKAFCAYVMVFNGSRKIVFGEIGTEGNWVNGGLQLAEATFGERC
jgi:hypothetical protein